jgi:hypothetical protein
MTLSPGSIMLKSAIACPASRRSLFASLLLSKAALRASFKFLASLPPNPLPVEGGDRMLASLELFA